MTIAELLAATGLTANDLVAIWDAEAASNVEPTQKITAAQFAAAVKTLASLLGTSDVVNNLSSTLTTAPLSANMGKTLNEAIAQSTATETYSTTLTTSKYNSFYYGNISVDTRNIISVIVYGSANNTFASAQLLDRQQNGNIRVFGDQSGGTVYVQVVRKAT